jgi:hypothetical protein
MPQLDYVEKNYLNTIFLPIHSHLAYLDNIKALEASDPFIRIFM